VFGNVEMKQGKKNATLFIAVVEVQMERTVGSTKRCCAGVKNILAEERRKIHSKHD